MNWLRNLRVASKLLVLIVVAIVSLGAVGLTGYHYLSKANGDMDAMYKEKLLPIQWLNDNRNQARGIEADIYDLMLTTNGNENLRLKQDIDKRTDLFEKNMAEYEKTKLDPFEVDTLKKLHNNLDQYRIGRKEAIDLALQNKNVEAYDIYNQKARVRGEAFHQDLQELAEHNTKTAEAINKNNQENFQQAMWIFLGIIVVAFILVMVLGWIIARLIAGSLTAPIAHLGEMAKGNFSIDVPEGHLMAKDEGGDLAKAFDLMQKNMRGLIHQLSNTSEQLAASSEELTASAEQSAQAANQVAGAITQVAQGAEKQLHVVVATTDVVGQMSQGIEQVAGNTQAVALAAEKTASAASDGGLAVETAIRQMSVIEQKTSETAMVIAELEDKSQEIGKIVEVIGSIAGQTNLLALNAAIEAARAGEQGRGFAVVAEEVRKLAEQSGQAAKQIAKLIGEVQQKTTSAVVYMTQGKMEVGTGTQVVNRAGESFREIVKMIQQMSEQIHEISAATEEITSGSQQVVKAVNEIDKESKVTAEQAQTVSAATEEQSASMEEIASSSHALSGMAEELRAAIGKFKV